MIPIITKQWTYPTNTQLQGPYGVATFAGVKTIRDTLQAHIEAVSTQFTSYNLVDTLANRPATCTTGVFYWETDHTQLDKCTSTNTWTNAVYVPYVYPSPLQVITGLAPIPVMLSGNSKTFGQGIAK